MPERNVRPRNCSNDIDQPRFPASESGMSRPKTTCSYAMRNDQEVIVDTQMEVVNPRGPVIRCNCPECKFRQ